MGVYIFVLFLLFVQSMPCKIIPCNVVNGTIAVTEKSSDEIANDVHLITDDVQEDGGGDTFYSMSVVNGKNVTACGNVTCSDNARGCLGFGVCNCLVGSEGDACDQDRDECITHKSVCGGGGYCVNTPGSFECVCLEGWIGEHCKTRNVSVDVQCLPGWTGNICNEDIDECANASVVCPGDHNTCLNIQGSFMCICNIGWTGHNCSEDIDDCRQNPCQNNSYRLNQMCTNTPGSFVCSCPTGFQGLNCTNDVDECISKPCLHSGTCVNIIGSFSCSCSEEWYGYLCESAKYDSTAEEHVNIALIVGATIGSLVGAGGIFVVTALLLRYKWRQEHSSNLVGPNHETSVQQEAKIGQLSRPRDGQRFQEFIMKTRVFFGNIPPQDK